MACAPPRFALDPAIPTPQTKQVFMPMPPLVEVLNMRWCPARQCIYVRFQVRIDTLSDQLYFDATSVYKVRFG